MADAQKNMITTKLLRQFDKSELNVYQIDSGETEWVVALSKSDALLVLAEFYGYSNAYERDYYQNDIVKMHDNRQLKLYNDHPFEDPTPFEAMPCRDWAKRGRQFLGSTCY